VQKVPGKVVPQLHPRDCSAHLGLGWIQSPPMDS